MKRFSQLYQALDQTTSTNAKVQALVNYFNDANAGDGAWAVYFLSGRRLKRLVSVAAMREWLSEVSDLPAWLVEETYNSVGDFAETVALLMGDDGDALAGDLSLAAWASQKFEGLRGIEPDAQKIIVTGWWRSLDYEGCYVVTKLLTGALRVGVSQVLVARALAQVADLPRPTILHRLMGEWTPTAEFYASLLSADEGEAALSRPYPFYLASPLDEDKFDATLGAVEQWQLEWKWDGIRGQLIHRQGQQFIWSRGEELVTARYPEVAAALAQLAVDCVLDGELVVWREGRVCSFAELQRRIGRKKVGKKLLAEVPVSFIAYDLLELDGQDIRDKPLAQRVHALKSVLADANETLRASPRVEAADWDDARRQQQQARERGVEGLMIKRLTAPYGSGRKRGDWWKWKVEPYTVDAVMLYAQAGHGRRANLYTDYTFAVWKDDQLVPIAKAYSGLSNEEITRLDRWIRRHTKERFGPVRSVEPVQVFELAFEGINRSTRHKSGIAVRFPRIVRWREDIGPGDADTLEQVKALLNDQDEAANGAD